MTADVPYSGELLDRYENAYFFAHDRADQLMSLMREVIKGEIVRKHVETLKPIRSGRELTDIRDAMYTERKKAQQ